MSCRMRGVGTTTTAAMYCYVCYVWYVPSRLAVRIAPPLLLLLLLLLAAVSLVLPRAAAAQHQTYTTGT